MPKAIKNLFDPKVFLAKVGEGKAILTFDRNEIVFAQGDVADTVVYIQQGRIKVFVVSEQGKEAVVEFDGVTGETRTGGSTFEQFLGRSIDAEFLINAGVEAAGIFIPGARLVEIVISKSLKARDEKKK